MKPYAIDLPGYVLRFSLPDEFVQSIMPRAPIETRFDPLNPIYFRDGTKSLAQISYVTTGFMGFGMAGDCIFSISVVRKKPAYSGNIENMDAFENYIRWLADSDATFHGFTISREVINGVVTSRWWLPASAAARGTIPMDIENYSFPLSRDSYLVVGFSIYESKPGSDERWKRKMMKLCEEIRSTIVFERKPNQPLSAPK